MNGVLRYFMVMMGWAKKCSGLPVPSIILVEGHIMSRNEKKMILIILNIRVPSVPKLEESMAMIWYM